MASSDAWNEGWALGSQRGEERRARKEELREADQEKRFNELTSQEQSLQQKYANAPDDATRQTVHQQILQNQSDWRNFFHPENNPGAIAKFGRRFMERLKLIKPPTRESVTTQTTMTNPETGQPLPTQTTTVSGPAMTDKQRAQFNKNQAADLAAAKSVEAGAPISAEDQAAINRRIDAANWQAAVQSKIDLFKQFNPQATQEDVEKYKNMVFESLIGATSAAMQRKPVGQPYKDINTGKWMQRYDYPDGTTQAEEIPGYTPTTHPSTSVFNVGLTNYAKSHGFDSFDSIPDQFKDAVTNYEIRKEALDRAFPTSTTTTTLRQDLNGKWVPVTVTNYRTPGGNVQLIDPMPIAGQGSASPAPAPSPAAPNGGGGGGSPAVHPNANPPRSSGSASVGSPLFQGRTPEYAKAHSALVDADRIADLADKWIAIPAGQRSEADASFVLALIRSQAGRVNQQEIAQLFNAGGISELPDRWAAKAGHGELPDDLRQQLWSWVHQQKDAAADALKDLESQNQSAPASAPTSAPASDQEMNNLLNILSHPPASGAH